MSRDEVVGRVLVSLVLFVVAMGCVMSPQWTAALALAAAAMNFVWLVWSWAAECAGWTRSRG